MDTRLLGRWILVGVVAPVLFVVMIITLAPVVADYFGLYDNASDDHCERSASGDPNRDDPDCRNDPWTGVNHVEEWDRAHPSP